MKTLLNISLAATGSLLLFGCTPEAQPIAYGTDNCHHCKMTITDSRYGSELVTKKGKVFKFDSVECMAVHLNKDAKAEDVHMVLVTDYTKPNTLIDASQAVFLQSENLPSPMGMYLTAFSGDETAIEFQNEKGGALLNWTETKLLCNSHGSH
jgi:copper chaperone NosL